MTTFQIDPDTGKWISTEPITHEQGLRIATSVLPGLPIERLDQAYTEWAESE